MKGGIILPDSAKKKQETARVMAIGSGKRLDDGKILPVPVNLGDVILMDKYSGQEVTIDDEEYMILKADDIIAIIEE
jgi:chaperonin GroES